MFEKEKLQKIGEGHKAYEQKMEKSLEKRPERKKIFESGSGSEINRLYSPSDLEDFDYMEDLEIGRASCRERV